MKKKNILITLFALILLLSVIAVTYAYYIGGVNNDNAQTANLTTGTMSLTFADNDNGFGGAIEFGQTITKKFTIQNTGTLEASASIHFDNMINTYTYGSLIYTLEYSETLNGTYTKLITDKKIPKNRVSSREILSPKITVPASQTYYYNLKITLVDSETLDQTGDLTATFFTQFDIRGISEEKSSEATLAALNLSVSNESPNFSLSSPGRNNRERIQTESEDFEITNDFDVAYSDHYIFDPISCYSLTNVTIGKYSEVYEDLVGKYILYPEDDVNFITDIRNICKVTAATSDTLSFIYYDSTQLSTYDYTDSSIYPMEDDYGTSYYFRGQATNNYVKFGKWADSVYQGRIRSDYSDTKFFSSLEECQSDPVYNVDCTLNSNVGKDMYWRIIRINGDGSLRIMYDGTQAYTSTANGLDRSIAYASFNGYVQNDIGNTKAGVGYMYGDGTSSNLDEINANTTDSYIKSLIDSWYKINLNENYTKYLSDTLFCNDRSIAYEEDGIVYYSAWKRYFDDRKPIFACPDKHDAFTVNDTTNGNGNLTYPIGLITMDEAIAAGYRSINSKNYLYKSTGGTYWTMTPLEYIYNQTSARVYSIKMGAGFMAEPVVNSGYYAAPVINISAEYAKTLKGTGTATDPFTL